LSPTASAQPHPIVSAFKDRKPINQEIENFVACEDFVEQSDKDTQGMGVMFYYGGEGDDLNESEYKQKMLDHVV